MNALSTCCFELSPCTDCRRPPSASRVPASSVPLISGLVPWAQISNADKHNVFSVHLSSFLNHSQRGSLSPAACSLSPKVYSRPCSCSASPPCPPPRPSSGRLPPCCACRPRPGRKRRGEMTEAAFSDDARVPASPEGSASLPGAGSSSRLGPAAPTTCCWWCRPGAPKAPAGPLHILGRAAPNLIAAPAPGGKRLFRRSRCRAKCMPPKPCDTSSTARPARPSRSGCASSPYGLMKRC